MQVKLEPPPIRFFTVVIDDPTLPRKFEFEVDARVPVEAEVRGAMLALAQLDESDLPRDLVGRPWDEQIREVAKYATVVDA